MLWHFCRVRKWVPEALDKMHVPRQAEPEKSRLILTIEQAARLMEASRDPDICQVGRLPASSIMCRLFPSGQCLPDRSPRVFGANNAFDSNNINLTCLYITIY